MYLQRTPLAPLLVLLVALLFPEMARTESLAQDWPHWSGPQGNLTASGNGLLDRPSLGLREAWKQPIGSGYSGLAAQGNKVLTSFADGDWDYLAAFDATTGQELWRYRIAKTYVGHDGSDDGPLGTPTLHGNRVYSVGPWGELFALDLETGEEIWSHQLKEVFSAPKPEYGFTTSPLVVGDLLIVQAGGNEGKSMVALDLESGKIRWSQGEGEVIYQSPHLLNLAAKPQIVAATTKAFGGFEPQTGAPLWQHSHPGESSEFSHPVPISSNRFLLSYWQETALFELQQSAEAEGEQFSVQQLWHNNSLQGTYNLPVSHGDHLYGFSRRFLVSVRTETGEVAWKSREPGAGNLILVDDHLVILTAAGEVVLAEANPEDYREVARLQVLEKECFRAPVFAAGRIYVRDLKHLAAVDITDAAPQQQPADPED